MRDGEVMASAIVVSRPAYIRLRFRLIKACEDIILGMLIFLLISPCLLVIALWIKWDSPGPVFFRQQRRGLNGRLFKIYKFLTMFVEETDHDCCQQSRRNDARVTRAGKFLRSHSLDELPQILNVLRGEMSLIGPRPHAPGTNINGCLLEELLDCYFDRYVIKPGMTGWAQVNGCRGILENRGELVDRVRYDLEYITSWSTLLDLKILLKTVRCLGTDEKAF